MTDWRRKHLAAFTGTDSPYPGYINVSYTEGGMIAVTVRGAHREDGSEGPSAAVELNIWNFANLFEVAMKALQASDIGHWPCRRCGVKVHPDDGHKCHAEGRE